MLSTYLNFTPLQHKKEKNQKLFFEQIRRALLSGAFYSSEHNHKARIREYFLDLKNKKIHLYVESNENSKIKFIGKGGKILQQNIGNDEVYKICGNEYYIRAEVEDDRGKGYFSNLYFYNWWNFYL